MNFLFIKKIRSHDYMFFVYCLSSVRCQNFGFDPRKLLLFKLLPLLTEKIAEPRKNMDTFWCKLFFRTSCSLTWRLTEYPSFSDKLTLISITSWKQTATRLTYITVLNRCQIMGSFRQCKSRSLIYRAILVQRPLKPEDSQAVFLSKCLVSTSVSF